MIRFKFIASLICSIFVFLCSIGFVQAKEEDEILAKNFLSLGIKSYEDQKIGPAIYYFRQALLFNDSLAEVHGRLGSAYYRNGVMDDAIQSYKKAIELNPNDTQTRNNLGITYYVKGMIDEAIEEYKKAILIDSRNSKTHNNLGVAYYAKKKLDLALIEYKEALNITPNDTEVQMNIGALYYDKGMLEDAISIYKQALKVSSKNSYAYFCLGLTYATQGNLKKAKEEIQSALKYNKEYEEASSIFSLLSKPESLFLNLGNKYCKNGEYDMAIDLYNRVLKINPNSKDVYQGLSLAYAQKASVRITPITPEPSSGEIIDTFNRFPLLATKVSNVKKVEFEEKKIDVSPVEHLIAYKGIVQPNF